MREQGVIHVRRIKVRRDDALKNTSGGWSGGAMVLGKLTVPGRPTILITVGQGPTALAVGAGGVVWTFLLSSILSLLSPSLWETARYRLKYCLKGPLSPKQPTNINTSVLPKQLKVAFLRVSVDPYIPNPLRCYACQVFGHHENKCHREEICANCGQPKHSADETDCKRQANCFNCNEDHPANSKQCPALGAFRTSPSGVF